MALSARPHSAVMETMETRLAENGTTQQEPRVGDIVLVQEPGKTWTRWPIGTVTAFHPSEDGVIRIATLKTGQGTITRSARSLRLVEPSGDALTRFTFLGVENLFSIPVRQYLTPHGKNIGQCTKSIVTRQKLSVMLYICHNSGGQLLKKHQSEMWLTARLFRLRLGRTV
ncbi:hypothetical protein T02_14524 [Trichinella nativa]|uniref:DUF5641 domain-containing protein n=1 Tax=Trichinella nativa TaxID=6335 RepID=A0A0V1KNI1_9BILA|nr:hypothetical protein T02_14524 [Trichinella nativa]